VKRRIERFGRGVYTNWEELNLREGEEFGENKEKGGGKPSNSSHSFPLESLILRGNELCLGSINIYNSFFNLWAYLCMEEIMDLRNSCLNCLNYIEIMLISIINCWDKLQLKHNYVFFQIKKAKNINKVILILISIFNLRIQNNVMKK